MYSNSYKAKYSFYKTLNIDSATMKTIQQYNVIKDRIIRNNDVINLQFENKEKK